MTKRDASASVGALQAALYPDTKGYIYEVKSQISRVNINAYYEAKNIDYDFTFEHEIAVPYQIPLSDIISSQLYVNKLDKNMKAIIKVKKIGNFVGEGIFETINNKVSFRYNDLFIEKIDDMPWVALTQLRKELELNGIFLMINGSRKDVHPSGMGMITQGAYILEMGKPADIQNMVNIFEPTTKFELISSVEDQEKYYLDWIDSSKKK